MRGDSFVFAWLFNLQSSCAQLPIHQNKKGDEGQTREHNNQNPSNLHIRTTYTLYATIIVTGLLNATIAAGIFITTNIGHLSHLLINYIAAIYNSNSKLSEDDQRIAYIKRFS
jgi:hypothetical protein